MSEKTAEKSNKQPVVSAKKETKETLVEEFTHFIARGNIIELAVGLTVGTAFTRLVNSLVNNLIMPPVGLLLGGTAFNNLFIPLGGGSYDSLEAAEAAGIPIIRYGQLISDMIDFLVISLAIFVVIKVIKNLDLKKIAKLQKARLTS